MRSRLALPFLLALSACASTTAVTTSDVPRADVPTVDVAPDTDAAAPDAPPDVSADADAAVAPDADAAVAPDAPRDVVADVDPCGGLMLCDGVCRDTAFDARHCGRCNNACAPAEECVRGACVMAPCIDPLVACAGACVDTSTDRANCGACACACPAGSLCSRGNCVVGCGAGLTVCGRITCGGEDAGAGARCIDTQTDRSNCGRCGEVCTDGQVCSQGRCLAPCVGGRTLCGSACRDLQTDVAHCGACGNACPAMQTCAAARCVPR